jgi:hypothetical protein
MNKLITLSASTALLSGLLFVTGCSSSDDGGGGTAAVPANATVIDANNAVPIVTSVMGATSTLGQALGAETTPVIGLNTALDLVKPMIKNRLKDSGVDLVTGATFNESYDCPYGGTFSATGDETDAYPNYSETVTATFNNCSEIMDVVIDGTVSGTFTENYETYEYTDSVTGSISIMITSDPDTFKTSFTGLSFQESGNSLDGTYTTTESTFALVIEVNGTTQFALLAELEADIVESSGTPCPESGHVLITGGNGTTAEGIYNGDGMTMTIKANGAVVDPSYNCSTI